MSLQGLRELQGLAELPEEDQQGVQEGEEPKPLSVLDLSVLLRPSCLLQTSVLCELADTVHTLPQCDVLMFARYVYTSISMKTIKVIIFLYTHI